MPRLIVVDGVVYEKRGNDFVGIGGSWPKRDGVEDLGWTASGSGSHEEQVCRATVERDETFTPGPEDGDWPKFK